MQVAAACLHACRVKALECKATMDPILPQPFPTASYATPLDATPTDVTASPPHPTPQHLVPIRPFLHSAKQRLNEVSRFCSSQPSHPPKDCLSEIMLLRERGAGNVRSSTPRRCYPDHGSQQRAAASPRFGGGAGGGWRGVNFEQQVEE